MSNKIWSDSACHDERWCRFVGGQDGCEGRFNFGGHHQDSFVKLLTQLVREILRLILKS